MTTLEYILHKQAEEAKQHVVNLDEVKNLLNTSERRLHASNRKYHRVKHKARMQIDLGLRGKRIVEVARGQQGRSARGTRQWPSSAPGS